MENQQSAETLRKRKFLVVLPLLICPFMTMAFWARGGVKGNQLIPLKSQEGFNTELPQAKFNDDEKQDKFSIYETAAKGQAISGSNEDSYNQLAFSESTSNVVDPNEQQINEKLAQINAHINSSPASEPNHSSIARSSSSRQAGNMSADVNRLEELMQNLQTGNGDDREMAQLNAVLEKILDIQHPGRTREKLTGKSTNPEGSYTVHVANDSGGKQNIFSIADNIGGRYSKKSGNAIQATIHQDQDIVSGSVVKLRLLDSINVRGTLIPKNEFIYGIAAVDGERLKIDIATLRYKNSIVPVSLSAFDLDGLEGLYIPGAITRDASKKGVDDAIQSLQIMTMDPSVSAQVAGAGIQAAKGLFSKKVKQVRVKVKAGYQLLLRDNNQRN